MTGGHSIDRVFIKKSISILDVNFKNEHFGVRELTKEMGVSRSQLYRKLKRITGKSTSKFICEFRLQKAMKMLQNNVATVSETAYRVGFNSPTYFNFCFYKYYGYPPGEVKYQEPVSSIESKDKGNHEPIYSLSKMGTANQIKEDISNKKVYRISLIVMILIIAFSYFMFINSYNNTILPNKKKDSTPSLAVLPFKNINNEIETQYLADGLWDDLLNHLSAIKGLDVRSRQSLEVYRESDKSMTDIGKELSAAYILESSIQKFDNKVRIITQLIDAKSDKFIWSHEYNYELVDVFKIQCEMSKSISEELNVILTSKEKEIIEKLPTDNYIAYQLVLKGRLFADIRTQKKLEKSIELYKQAIVLDSNYARAYAEIAQSYFILRNRGHHSYSSVDSAKIYVEKALNVDPNTFRAYAVRARINDYYEEWDKCKENFEKAIALNPNDA
ncbi:MAG: helix-turn-helix domain-containing protein, partial [Flavobacteriaceae bacterium]|nr:helix-turn-helix domain-containing protein [Flavobacteriaceae bacterium]